MIQCIGRPAGGPAWEKIALMAEASPSRPYVNPSLWIDMYVNLPQNGSMATVVLTPEATIGLEELNNPIHGRVLQLLVKLEQWPSVSGAKPLRGELAGRYRLRTGDYRIQFHVAGDVVVVESIGHRDGFYGE